MDPRARVARLNPCPSFIRATLNSLPFRNQPINRSSLILPGQALFKAINKLHRQKKADPLTWTAMAELSRGRQGVCVYHRSNVLYQGTTSVGL
jgi:hypothetical protein